MFGDPCWPHTCGQCAICRGQGSQGVQLHTDQPLSLFTISYVHTLTGVFIQKKKIQNGRGTTFLRLSSETRSTLLQSECAHLCLIKADTRSLLRVDRISNDGDDDAQLQPGSGACLRTPPQKLTTRPHCLLPLPLPTQTHLIQFSKLSLKRSRDLPNSTLRISGAISSASSRHRPSLPQTSSHTFQTRTASEPGRK